jgi:MoxR-like ATPase
VLEAARARAAADDRKMATVEDVAAVAPMALRQRRSEFIRRYFEAARTEETQIATVRRKAMENSHS